MRAVAANTTRDVTSRDRIKKTLNFELPDRIGIADEFCGETLKRWRNAGLPANARPEEHFGFDIRVFGFEQGHLSRKDAGPSPDRLERPAVGESIREAYEAARRAGRFLALGLVEPFEDVSRAIGREMLLEMMAGDANGATRLLGISLESSVNMCRFIFEKVARFDGAWLWGDMAYKKGPFFSTDYYDEFLSGPHSELCRFFGGYGMPVILHTDGNIRELLPQFIGAGIRAVTPLEADVGMDITRLKREYGRDIVLFGGIDEAAMQDEERFKKEIAAKFPVLKEGGGYIYHADSPIPEDVSLERYTRCLEIVRENGNYLG